MSCPFSFGTTFNFQEKKSKNEIPSGLIILSFIQSQFKDNRMSQDKHRLKKCRKCFNYNSPKSRKCKYCGNKFKTSGKWSLVDAVKQVLRIDRGFAMPKAKTPEDSGKFFTKSEIETLVTLDNMTILMFLTLDDINILNENALLELGQMLTEMNRA